MMDAPLDTAALPGFAPVPPRQLTELVHAAIQTVALARAALEAPAPRPAVPWWRRLFPPPRRAPAGAALEGDALIRALKPIRDVCLVFPAESARLLGVLVGQAILSECLRGDLGARGRAWAETRTIESTIHACGNNFGEERHHDTNR